MSMYIRSLDLHLKSTLARHCTASQMAWRASARSFRPTQHYIFHAHAVLCVLAFRLGPSCLRHCPTPSNSLPRNARFKPSLHYYNKTSMVRRKLRTPDAAALGPNRVHIAASRHACFLR